MKVTYNWLKEFVDIKIPAGVLADKLTMAGLEVKSIEEKSGDFVFEIEITSNRPDWLSVVGVAREVAVITGAKLKLPICKGAWQAVRRGAGQFNIKIENKKDCPLYIARIINGIKIGESPDWLRQRLELIGCRSVNNIVDITNFILFEWGQPLHAFDFDKLYEGTVCVRRAKSGEKITVISGEEKNLDAGMLIIADKKAPIAIAGVMGGKYTEVTETTRNILLEAAVFNPVLVRQTRQKLGLSSESSYRFERGIDQQSTEMLSSRATELIMKIAGGKLFLSKSSGIQKNKSAQLLLESASLPRVLGIGIKAAEVKKTLSGLGFTAVPTKQGFKVAVPSWRQDVCSEIDLIEEIGRIMGYENVPPRIPAVKTVLTKDQRQDSVDIIKNSLIGLGLSEAITYSLTAKRTMELFSPADKAISIRNPLSSEQEVLRTTLVPGILNSAAYNLNQRQEFVGLFEIARVYHKEVNYPKEELMLGIVICGTKALFLKQGLVKDEASLLHLKGIAEKMFGVLGIYDYSFKAIDGEKIDIYTGHDKIGSMVSLSVNLREKFDIKNTAVFVLELSVDKLLKFVCFYRKFKPLPKYPGITRDTSFVIKETVGAQEVLAAIRNSGLSVLLSEVKVADYYKGQQIPAGFKGLTISCLYRSQDKTLTEEEVEPLHSAVFALLERDFGARMR